MKKVVCKCGSETWTFESSTFIPRSMTLVGGKLFEWTGQIDDEFEEVMTCKKCGLKKNIPERVKVEVRNEMFKQLDDPSDLD